MTVDVATTKAFIAPNGGGAHSVNVGTGNVKVHAGAANNTSAIADAGNVTFAPDTPTFTNPQTTGGTLEGGKTYYYRISALNAGDQTTAVNGGSQTLSGTGENLTVFSTSGFGSSGKFTVPGVTGRCSYTATTGTQFQNIHDCTGTPADGAQVSNSEESVPGAEGNYKVPDGTNTNQVQVNWNSLPNANGYNVYRGTTSGEEQLVASNVSGTSYNDTGTAASGAMPTESASAGIGIAIAVNVAVINTDAFLAGNTTISAGSVSLESVSDGPSGFKVHATAGAGGSSVGVAGSIAVNVVVSNTVADVETPTPVAVNGDVSMNASSNLFNSATADAKQGSDGKASGVGASVAVNVVNDTTSAGLPDGAVLTGANNLTANATGSDRMVTVASGGASAGSGSIALSAQVAIAISNITTTASIGTGSALTINGALTAKATQNAGTTSTATGSASGGGTAAIGLSLALVVANHIVLSQLNRNLTASGNVSFTANGASANDTEAKSSAAGAPEKDGSSASTTVNGGSQDLSGGTLVVHDTSKFKSTGSFKVAGGTGTCSYGSKTATEFDTVSACTGTPDDGAAVTQDDNSTDSSGKDVNGKADDNLKVGNDRSKESDNGKDSGDGSTPKAKSGENGGTTVTVAAAVGIAVITAHSLANIADSTTLSTGGSLSLTSSEDVDSKVTADGSATEAKTATIGAAVAINLVKHQNEASSGTGDAITANGLSFSAGMNKSGPDKGNWSSGTDYSKGDVTTDTSDHKRYVAKNSVSNDTTAPHSDATNWKLINNWVSGTTYAAGDVVTDTDGKQYVAQGALANNTAAPNTDPVNWMPLSNEPDGKNTLDAESTAGSSGGKVSVAGSLALTLADFETSAEIRSTGGGGVILGTHDLSLSADSSVSDTSKAKASSKDSTKVGVGAGAAIALTTDITSALIDAGAVFSGAQKVTLSASGEDEMTTYAEAGTAGKDGSTLSLTADAAIALPKVWTTASIGGGTVETLTASGAVSINASQKASTTNTAKANAVNGTVVIGLALGIAIPDDQVHATISRTVTGTTVTLTASGSANDVTEADASATGAKGKGDDTSGKDVNGKGDDQVKNANQEGSDNTGKTSDTTDTSKGKAETSDKNEQGGNTVTVAGAAAINIAKAITDASLARPGQSALASECR